MSIHDDFEVHAYGKANLEAAFIKGEILKKNAKRHEIRQVLKSYMDSGNRLEKQGMAKILKEHTKLTHQAICELNIDPKPIWFDLKIHKDMGDNRDKLSKLPYSEKATFRTAYRYKKYERAAAEAWKKAFDAKKGEKNLFAKAKHLTSLRDKYAHKISEHKVVHRSHFRDLEIKENKLDKHAQLYANRVHEGKNYIQNRDKVVRQLEAMGAKANAAKLSLIRRDMKEILEFGDKARGKEQYYRDVFKENGISIRSIKQDRSLLRAVITLEKSIKNPGRNNANKEYKSYDLNALNKALASNAESIAQHYLGDKNARMSRGNQLRFGSKGSLAINASGPKAGLWYDFETGESGNMLGLIHKHIGGEFKDTFKVAEKHLNQSIDTFASNVIQPKAIKQEEKQDQGRIHTARLLSSKARPAKGTIVEKYLKEHRKIDMEVPPTIKYLPANRNYLPAMLVESFDKKGQLTGVQITKLDPVTGNKIDEEKVGVVKQSFGKISENGVLLQQGTNNKLFAGEGVETMATVASVERNSSIRAALGINNIKNVIQNCAEKDITIVGEIAGSLVKSKNQLASIVKEAELVGKQVKFVFPDKINEKSGLDFNDVAIEKGTSAVSQGLKKTEDFTQKVTQAAAQRRAQQHVNQQYQRAAQQLNNLQKAQERAVKTAQRQRQTEREI